MAKPLPKGVKLYGHPILAIVGVFLVQLPRVLLTAVVDLMVVGGVGVGFLARYLPQKWILILMLIASVIIVGIILIFRDDENLFHYDFSHAYGNHSLGYFVIYQVLLWGACIGCGAYVYYKCLTVWNGSNALMLAAVALAVCLPMCFAQPAWIRALGRKACKHCFRANCMGSLGSYKRDGEYVADYKTVGGYDVNLGEIEVGDQRAKVVGYVPKRKVISGVSQWSYHSENLECTICGRRKTVSDAYKNKVI